MPEGYLSDFDNQPWCQELLKSDVEIMGRSGRASTDENIVSNSMMEQTLMTEQAVRAIIVLKRKTADGAVAYPDEYCMLLSLGNGVDGMRGRAHGGFNALVIDQLTGV